MKRVLFVGSKHLSTRQANRREYQNDTSSEIFKHSCNRIHRNIKYYADKVNESVLSSLWLWIENVQVHRVKGHLVVDSTFGPPPLQYPFKWDADCVMHSGTISLLAVKDKFFKNIQEQSTLAVIQSYFAVSWSLNLLISGSRWALSNHDRLFNSI